MDHLDMTVAALERRMAAHHLSRLWHHRTGNWYPPNHYGCILLPRKHVVAIEIAWRSEYYTGWYAYVVGWVYAIVARNQIVGLLSVQPSVVISGCTNTNQPFSWDIHWIHVHTDEINQPVITTHIYLVLNKPNPASHISQNMTIKVTITEENIDLPCGWLPCC